MSRMIKITIAGPPGSGKSTIAQLIAQTLERVGIKGEMLDGDDCKVTLLECAFSALRDNDCMARDLKAIVQNPVQIETVQIKGDHEELHAMPRT